MLQQTFPKASPVPIEGAGRTAGEQGPTVLRIWRMVLRWRWVIIGIVTLALVAGLLLTLLSTRQYTATATIEIARQQDKVVNVQDVRQESNALDQEFYQTQYSLLQARTLAESVVTELKLAENEAFFDMFGVDLPGEGLFGQSAGRRLTPAQRAERQQQAVKILLKKISISPIRGSSIVSVSFTSPDPVLSAQIANAWIKNFIEANLARRYEATAYARQFLESRLEQLRQRLEESERQLVGYASAQRLVSVAGTDAAGGRFERPLVAEDLAMISRALNEATADRIAAEARLAGGGGAGVGREMLDNSAISSLRAKRAELAAEYARLLSQFEPTYPAAQAIREQLSQLDRSIAAEEARARSSVRTAYREAVERENELRARVEALKSGLLDVRRRSIQYNIYQRDVDTNRALYEGLLQRYKEIGVAGGIGTNNVAVVDPALPPDKPSQPRPVLNMGLALLLGLVLAAGVTLALDQIDEVIKDPSEVGRLIGQPLLGSVPVTEGSVLEVLGDRKSPISEAYLSVQTSLQFATDHGIPRTLAVTSTRAAEGKSTTSFAIAQSLARTGRRVVLIDADMRSPSLHTMFGVENSVGLSNVLAGGTTEGVVRDLPEFGLSLITAGPQPPNAGELLTGSRLRNYLDLLLETFDQIVIDSPPVLGLADAPLIGSVAEGVVYAVVANGVRANAVRTALSRLTAANAHVVGVVLTKFEAARAAYGYDYDYGYGYGQDDPSRSSRRAA